MGRKTFSDAEVIMIRSYLLGISRDETARNASVSAGTVSNYWAKLKLLFGSEGEALRELSIRLKRNGIMIEEAILGAEIASIIKRMKIEDRMLQDFMSKVYRASIEHGYDPEQVVDYAIRLSNLQTRIGVDYEQIIQDYESKKEELTRLEEQIRKLNIECSEAIERRDRALEDENVTVETLKEYTLVKSQLVTIGLDVGDFHKLCRTLSNAKEQGYNLRWIIESLSKIESLSAKIKNLETEISSLERRKEDLDNEVRELEKIKMRTEESINTISNKVIPQLIQISKEVNQLLLNLKGEIESGIKELKKNVEESVSGIRSLATESLEKVGAAMEKLNPALERLSKAEELGEQIGKLEAIAPLLTLIGESKGTQYEVLPVIRITLDAFRTWVKTNYPNSSIEEQLSKLISLLDREIATCS